MRFLAIPKRINDRNVYLIYIFTKTKFNQKNWKLFNTQKNIVKTFCQLYYYRKLPILGFL